MTADKDLSSIGSASPYYPYLVYGWLICLPFPASFVPYIIFFLYVKRNRYRHEKVHPLLFTLFRSALSLWSQCINVAPVGCRFSCVRLHRRSIEAALISGQASCGTFTNPNQQDPGDRLLFPGTCIQLLFGTWNGSRYLHCWNYCIRQPGWNHGRWYDDLFRGLRPDLCSVQFRHPTFYIPGRWSLFHQRLFVFHLFWYFFCVSPSFNHVYLTQHYRCIWMYGERTIQWCYYWCGLRSFCFHYAEWGHALCESSESELPVVGLRI